MKNKQQQASSNKFYFLSPQMQLLTDRFQVSDIDKEGKLYTSVSRAYLDAHDCEIILDYHSMLCKLEKGASIDIRIFTGTEPNVECEYLMSGRVYNVKGAGSGRVDLRASFGGLLLILKVPGSRIENVSDGSEITLALTKVC
jgi:DNA-directed RNA polymerases I, II, and III subunit RPABC3